MPGVVEGERGREKAPGRDGGGHLGQASPLCSSSQSCS